MKASLDCGIFELDVRADFEQMAQRLHAAGNQAPHVVRRAINRAGDKARTKVARALAKQTGAKYGTVRRALTTRRASYGMLAYRIVGFGGFLPLSEFSARQRKDGVSAAPWGTRRVFKQAFISSALGGHVFIRERAPTAGDSAREGAQNAQTPKRVGRLPIRELFGPAIPRELLKGDVKATFEATVAAELPIAAERELGALLAGFAPRG